VKPIDQRYFAPPEGDCWIACIASILERPIEQFDEVHRLHTEKARDWYERGCPANGFEWDPVLASLHRVGVHPTWMVEPCTVVPHGYAIASGQSPRGDWLHAVVAHYGAQVHDPHPSRDGLAGPVIDWCVLVPVETKP